MSLRECPWEEEILAEAMQSRWPEQADAALRAHVTQCASCSEAAVMACSMAAAREEGTHGEIPEAGRVWWRAQLRARREAAKSAGRPITAAQVIAFACAAGLLGACFGATSTWFQSLVRTLISGLSGLRLPQLGPIAAALIAQYGAWVAAGSAVLLVIPTAIYLAFLRE
jgi:hypothetical protein